MAISLSVPAQIIEQLTNRNCVVFVGDALDKPQSTASGLSSLLIDACNAHCRHCKAVGQCKYPESCEVPFPKAAMFYQNKFERKALIDVVLEYIEKTSQLLPVHHLLAQLPVQIMVTTAFDDHLETALRMANRNVLSVVNDKNIPFDDPEHVQVIRLHGTVRQPDSLVLTLDDGYDLFARLPVVKNVLSAHFANKTLLFVGYDHDLEDAKFNLLYRQATKTISDFVRTAYAQQWETNTLVQERWKGKIEFISSPPLLFLESLLQPINFSKEKEDIALAEIESDKVILPLKPYKFLDYFTEKDAAIFFGRDLEADLLLSQILSNKLSIFYGASGTGKTSLLLAQVQPALIKAGFYFAYARMLEEPLKEVQRAILRAVQQISSGSTSNHQTLSSFLVNTIPPESRLVLILDQFEEFFLRQAEDVRYAFAEELAECIWTVSEEYDIDVRVVISIRDDYLGFLDELSPYIRHHDIFASRYRLRNLSPDKALVAILKPAEAFGLPIAEALRDQLIIDLDNNGLEPANLQIVLYQLYEDAVSCGNWIEETKTGIGLTKIRYEKLGGTQQILARYLDNVIADLSTPEDIVAAQAILKSMVTVDKTKKAISHREIKTSSNVKKLKLSESQLDHLLSFFRNRRVIRKFGEDNLYELAHDVMVGKVWAWFKNEEIRALDVRDMLQRELSSYQKFGHILTPEKLEMVDPYFDILVLNDEEMEMVVHSAFATGQDSVNWLERAKGAGLELTNIAQKAFDSKNYQSRAAAVNVLTQEKQIAVHDLIPFLADEYPLVRAAAIHALEKLAPDLQWHEHLKYECFVPAGEFEMGYYLGDQDERPVCNVYVNAFYISKFPATNLDYSRFMNNAKQLWQMPEGKEHHPVVNVSWESACEYALWAGMRLLTEAEWEKAATWLQNGKSSTGYKLLYPWGDTFVLGRCNSSDAGNDDTTPVGHYSPQGDSPFGVADMVGNVWEWTNSLFYKLPYKAGDGRENPMGHRGRVLRGGGYYNEQSVMRGSYRNPPTYPMSGPDFGFRCGFSSTLNLDNRKYYLVSQQKENRDVKLINRIRLKRMILRYFTKGEMEGLCFDLGIDKTNLVNINMSALAQEIIRHSEQQKKQARLLSLCRDQRPTAKWPKEF